jgi:hypothetical protein
MLLPFGVYCLCLSLTHTVSPAHAATVVDALTRSEVVLENVVVAGDRESRRARTRWDVGQPAAGGGGSAAPVDIAGVVPLPRTRPNRWDAPAAATAPLIQNPVDAGSVCVRARVRVHGTYSLYLTHTHTLHRDTHTVSLPLYRTHTHAHTQTKT